MFLITDAIEMIRQIRAQGRAIGAWGAILNMTQIIGGLLFILFLEGQVVLAVAILVLMVAGQIHKRTPFSRLVGLCHIPWLLLLPWLIYRFNGFSHPVYLKVWMAVVIVLILSLIHI